MCRRRPISPSSIGRRLLCGATIALAVCAVASAQTLVREYRVLFLTSGDARPVVEQFAAALSPELTRILSSGSSGWPDWVRRRDADIRARLKRGDVDSMINLLLFGSSFSSQPRLTAHRIEQIVAKGEPSAGAELDAITARRLDDFLNAARNPGSSERFAYVRSVLASAGYALDSSSSVQRARAFLVGELSRVLKEIDTNARAIDEARRTRIAGAEFAERSRLYRSRGLSSDTSLPPNFAIEESLKAIQQQGRLSRKIRRVAVIGPGLDFTDKQEGYDFYPEQTIQPFAVIDSLLRLGLAERGDLWITALDLNPRVQAHVSSLRARSLGKDKYVLQLPIAADEGWNAGFLQYWQRFGDRIGAPVDALRPPKEIEPVKTRAVAVRPAIVETISGSDLNIVLQRLELPADERFDLIVATNIFVYYDDFEKALAMVNVDRMLRAGGLLLSNNALVELPSPALRWVGDTTVRYADRPDSGDTIVWYQK